MRSASIPLAQRVRSNQQFGSSARTAWMPSAHRQVGADRRRGCRARRSVSIRLLPVPISRTATSCGRYGRPTARSRRRCSCRSPRPPRARRTYQSSPTPSPLITSITRVSVGAVLLDQPDHRRIGHAQVPGGVHPQAGSHRHVADLPGRLDRRDLLAPIGAAHRRLEAALELLGIFVVVHRPCATSASSLSPSRPGLGGLERQPQPVRIRLRPSATAARSRSCPWACR